MNEIISLIFLVGLLIELKQNSNVMSAISYTSKEITINKVKMV